MPRTKTHPQSTPSSGPAKTRQHRDKVPAWYDPSDPTSVARYRDLVADRETARSLGVPVVWFQSFRRGQSDCATAGGIPPRRAGTTGKWCQDQRTSGRKGTLSEAQIALLETLPGWEWDPEAGTRPDEENFATNADELEAFVVTNGRYPLGSLIEERRLFDFWRVQTGSLPGYRTRERDQCMHVLPGWPGPVCALYQPH